ncbi:hypothetical protein ACH4NO_18305 [Streptomyces olivaceus]|uniref:hypothetical protein n=1 Tax=Streptomyces olivaceus TaxID=47716 RepID=UPI0037994C81
MMVAEALDVLGALLVAGGLWLLGMAAVLTLVLWTAAVTLYAAVRGAVRALGGLWRLWRPGRRPRPSWALRGRTARRYACRRPDYEEAA